VPAGADEEPASGWIEILQRARGTLYSFDFLLLGALALLLVPLFGLARLPLEIDFEGITAAYWGGSAAMAICTALLLALVCLPAEQVLLPTLRRYREEKMLCVIALTVTVSMVAWIGPALGTVAAVDALGVAELVARRQGRFLKDLWNVVVPGIYLFAGLVLVFACNHAMVGIRYGATYDGWLKELDWRIFHLDVSATAHWGFRHLPHWLYRVMEFNYGLQFPKVGAALLLASLLGGRKFSERYVRTVVIAYVVAMGIFFLMPAKGPYALCAIHLTEYPRWLQSFWAQETLTTNMHALWTHNLSAALTSVSIRDYYISFPSMHAALPVIAIWQFRRWRGLAWALTAMYVVLLFSLVLLEWHYGVDIVGGMATAALAIWVEGRIVAAYERESLPEALPAMAGD
jgi:PAP2 superfamily